MPGKKNNNKKAAAKPEKEEDIDAVLAQFAAKRCDQLLDEIDLSELGKQDQPAATISTKQDRRNKRKDWEKNGKPVPLDNRSQHILDSTIPEPDQPLAPLTWDPLALSGPHSAIGAGAAAEQVRLAAVALD